MPKIVIIDVSRVLKIQPVTYNESLLEIEHSNISGSPFSLETDLKQIEKERFKTLKDLLK